MNPETQALWVFIVGMLVLIATGMNMALALVLTGAGMAWVLGFFDTQLLAQNLVAGVDSFPLLAVPFFVLAGEHMAFTSLAARLRQRPAALAVWTVLIRLLVLLAAALVAWGAWQQVHVGLGSRSVVLGYPTALLPLPALLCSATIAVTALFELVTRRPLDLGHVLEAE